MAPHQYGQWKVQVNCLGNCTRNMSKPQFGQIDLLASRQCFWNIENSHLWAVQLEQNDIEDKKRLNRCIIQQ